MRLLIIFLAVLILNSCKDEVYYSPKPRAYPKVDYPKKAFQKFDNEKCDCLFDYPKYANLEWDTKFFDQDPIHPCWFDLNMKALNAKVHFSYYPITKENSLDKLLVDGFKMADKHNKRASFINEIPVMNQYDTYGFVFDIEGPAASPYQFFLTDSTNHFIRGALYFNTQARPDSLAPITEFIKEDLSKLIEGFQFK